MMAAITRVSPLFHKDELVLFDHTLYGKRIFSSLLLTCETEE